MAVGAWMLAKPNRTRLRAKKTSYPITNRRVPLIKYNDCFSVSSLFAHEFSHYSRKDKPDGSGSIRFRRSVMNGRRGSYLQTNFSDGLWGIDDVKGGDQALSKFRSALANQN